MNSKHIFDHASKITEILDRMRQIEPDPPHDLESLSAKVAALRSLVQGGPPQSLLMESCRWAPLFPAPVGNFSLAMLRLGESGGFTHAMFPLSQHHTTLTCVQCHTPDEMNARWPADLPRR